MGECGSGRIEDRDVIETSCSGGWGRAALGLPRVEAEVVVIAAGRQEEGFGHPEDHVETKDADVEVVDALDVGGLEVDVTDSRPGGDGFRCTLAGRYGRLVGCRRCFGAHVPYSPPENSFCWSLYSRWWVEPL